MRLSLFQPSSKLFLKNMALNIAHQYRCDLRAMEKLKDKIELS